MSSENEAKKRWVKNIANKKDSFSTIYVSGLDEDIKNYHLRVHFEQFGKVNDAHIIYDKLTRKSKGFGFVEFDVLEDYKRAFEHQNHVICGKQVEIKTHKINSSRF
jgi:RNA recognition motif-containing protein